MKFDCGPPPEEQAAARAERLERRLRTEFEQLVRGRPIFAFWPRRVVTGECRWLEYVNQQMVLSYVDFRSWDNLGRSRDSIFAPDWEYSAIYD